MAAERSQVEESASDPALAYNEATGTLNVHAGGLRTLTQIGSMLLPLYIYYLGKTD